MLCGGDGGLRTGNLIGAIFNGLTLEQVIARDFGFLAAPLFAVALVLLIAGIVLLWTDTP